MALCLRDIEWNAVWTIAIGVAVFGMVKREVIGILGYWVIGCYEMPLLHFYSKVLLEECNLFLLN